VAKENVNKIIEKIKSEITEDMTIEKITEILDRVKNIFICRSDFRRLRIFYNPSKVILTSRRKKSPASSRKAKRWDELRLKN
jgi:hypothetical protein